MLASATKAEHKPRREAELMDGARRKDRESTRPLDLSPEGGLLCRPRARKGQCGERAALDTGSGRRRERTARLFTRRHLNTTSLCKEVADQGEARPLTRQARLGLRGEHQPLRQRTPARPGARGPGAGAGVGPGGGRDSGLSPQLAGWAGLGAVLKVEVGGCLGAPVEA